MVLLTQFALVVHCTTHVPLPLQRPGLPLLHGMPALTLVTAQPVAWLQVSAVHELLSLQAAFEGALVQPAPEQVSVVQATLSLHAEFTGTT